MYLKFEINEFKFVVVYNKSFLKIWKTYIKMSENGNVFALGVSQIRVFERKPQFRLYIVLVFFHKSYKKMNVN